MRIGSKTAVTALCLMTALGVLTPSMSGRRITTKVDTKALQARYAAERQDSLAMCGRRVLTGDSAVMAVRLYGYDKPYSSTRESVFVSNELTADTIESLEVRVEYMTMRGESLHSRVVTMPCHTGPGRSERILFRTWDATHTFYFHRTPPGRKQGLTPYTVLLTPLAVYVR